MIYVGRPVLCSQGDARHIQVTLYYALEPHQLPKLFSAVVVVHNDDDASNYETTTETMKLLIKFVFKWS